MRSTDQKPIFYDPTNARWPKIRAGMLGFAAISAALLIGLLVAILINPVLHPVALPDAKNETVHPIQSKRAALQADQKYQQEREAVLRDRKRMLERTTSSSTEPLDISGQSVGFFVDWDDASYTSLKQNLPRLNVVVGEWMHLTDATGTLREDDSEKETEVIAYIRAHKPDAKIYALVNNYDGASWQSEAVASALANATTRAHIVQGLVADAQAKHVDGISIDIENLASDKLHLLTVFVQDIAVAAHAQHLAVTVNAPADDDSFEYAPIADAADAVIVMAYDEHWSTGEPGPIASQNWFMNIMEKRSADIPNAKRIIALGNYGYDWLPGKRAEEKTFQEAVTVAKESEGDVYLEDVSMNPTYEYADDQNATHVVWMLDAVTSFNQMVAAKATQPAGFALWRLGSEDPSIWTFFGASHAFDATLASSLESMTAGYDIDYEGDGEVLTLAATPQTGKRTIVFDPDQGLITTEEVTQFPSAYVIRRYGTATKKIALTFDDGPDSSITPQILDVLKTEHVPATFFVVGANAEANPDLLEREYDEGHEIGSHSFTHPNIAELSPRMIDVELSATQRLIEGYLGHQTLLFRPPYAEDVEPETPDETAPLITTSRLGYLDVGMRIDPSDWKSPGVDEIVQRTVAQAEAGRGNVVLLHDAGGDRTQTIQALPKMIEALRAKGYEFVTISSLMGKTRDDVMPPVSGSDIVVGRVTFQVASWVLMLLSGLGTLGIVLGIFRSIMMSVLAIVEARRKRKTHTAVSPNVSVAVIVPAYNEERVVTRTVSSLLESDHPNAFEIVVVDDGSKDATVARLHEAFDGNPRVKILTKENGGKPAALNLGIAQTHADIVICLDADTIFTRNCITELIAPFADPNVGAVAGNAKVGNRINLITRLQALEYVTSQNLDRRAFDVMNCITVVPGAVGAWRRELVMRAGGFRHRTLAEDADLTFMIRKMGYRITYQEHAIALTEAPDTFRGFLKQRFRWMYGTLQVAWAHRDVLFRPQYGSLGFVALPNVIIFQVFFNFVSPLMDAMLGVTMIRTALDAWMHPSSFSTSNLERIAFIFAVFTLLDAGAAVLAFVLEKREDPKLLFWIFWQRFLYRQLMYVVAIRSVVAGLRGNAVGWNKVERKGTVSGQNGLTK